MPKHLMIIVGAVLTLVVGAAALIAMDGSSAASPREQFFSEVHQDPYLSTIPDDALWSAAATICQYQESGHMTPQEALYVVIAGTSGMPTPSAENLIAASWTCPHPSEVGDPVE